MKHLKSIVVLTLALGFLPACGCGDVKVVADADTADTSDVPAEPDTGGEDLVTDEGTEGTLDAVEEPSIYPLTVTATADWDIGSDNNNNLYIMWCSGSTIYFGQIADHAVTGQQTVTDDANTDKYGWPRLSVQPNGQTMSIVYRTTAGTLNHAWRDSGGTWEVEPIPAETSTNGYWSQAGAVGGDGTVHAAYVVGGVLYYTYKTVGGDWIEPSFRIDEDSDAGCSGTHMVVDSNGGIHINWMPYTRYLRYRYAAPGGNLFDSDTQEVNCNCDVVAGSGDLYATPSGTVHMILGHNRALYHTSKIPGGSFSDPTMCSGGPYDTTNDHHSAISVDESGKVYVSWGEQYSNRDNVVKLSVLEDGAWTVSTVDSESLIDTKSKPGIAMTSQALYLLWRHHDNSLYLGEYPLH